MLKPFVLAATLCAAATSAALAESVRVPADTPVSIQVTTPVSSKTAHVGDTVPLKVTEDVIVNGYVVIARGADGKAVVDAAQPAQMNSTPGTLHVTYKWVRSVDGSKIGVNGIFTAQGPNAAFGQTQAQIKNLSQTATDQKVPQAAQLFNRINNLVGHTKTGAPG
jgi:hypothetical protein